MQARLKEVKLYMAIKKGLMTIGLLKYIKMITFGVQSHQYLLLSVYKTLRTYMMS